MSFQKIIVKFALAAKTCTKSPTMLNRDELLEEYIEGHIDPEPELLRELYRHTQLHRLYPRMCAGHYQGRLLKMFTAMINPRRILEIGTFTGYSTLAMASALTGEARIDTVEVDDEHQSELQEWFDRSPYSHRITLHVGDALDILPSLSGPYEMVLIDANKRFYQQYLEAVLPLVPKGGFILADNTLWDMKVVETEECSDAQTRAIMDFNDALAADNRFEKVILPVRDGLTIIRRI